MTPPSTPLQQQYGLPDFGRRVPGLGESNARRAYYAKPSKLPAPDGFWPGERPPGRPWWWESTVDAYARSAGKPVPADARWPQNWPTAAGPAPLLPPVEVTLPGTGTTVSVLVYDTQHAPVAYVLRHDLDTTAATAAAAAAHAVPAADWRRAIVLVADFRLLGDDSAHDDLDVYRLTGTAGAGPVPARRGGGGLFARLLGASDPADDEQATTDPRAVSAVYAGGAYADQVARVLGRSVPMWLDFTCTPDTVRQSLAYGDNAPVPAPETSTDWPRVRTALSAAAELGVPERFPQAFALLAADALATAATLQQRLTGTARAGDGWYLAAMPPAPSWPVELEHRITTAAATGFDADAAAAELTPLRAEEAALAWNHPAGDALSEAIGSLAYRLRSTHPDLVHAAGHRQVVESAGPVTEQYLAGLTALTADQRRELLEPPTRRLARLLTGERLTGGLSESVLNQAADRLTDLYQAPDGRLSAQSRSYHGDTTHLLAIEWPAGQPLGWSDDTRIAGDGPGDEPVLVVALTPDPAAGGLRTDLLPNPGHEPGYTWGYNGGGPRTLYAALVRCATGQEDHPLTGANWMTRLTAEPSTSALYATITAHHGPLRLLWRDVRQHVQDDLARQEGRDRPAGGAGQPHRFRGDLPAFEPGRCGLPGCGQLESASIHRTEQ